MRRVKRDRPGVCRWCGCSEFDPCPESCGWANREGTLCTACVNIDRAWRQMTRLRQMPNMVRAFFRGYMAGSDDERATETQNPYANGRTHAYWSAGQAEGLKEAR